MNSERLALRRFLPLTLIFFLLLSAPSAQGRDEVEIALPALDSGLLCDRLTKVGTQCFRTATKSRCVRTWAKRIAQTDLIAKFQLDPSDPRWDPALALFDGACQLACSLKLNNESLYLPGRFCRELGVRPGPSLNLNQ